MNCKHEFKDWVVEYILPQRTENRCICKYCGEEKEPTPPHSLEQEAL